MLYTLYIYGQAVYYTFRCAQSPILEGQRA